MDREAAAKRAARRRRMHPSRRQHDEAAARREMERIESLKMWMTGASYKRIGEALNVAPSTAYRRVQDALDAMRPHADYDRYRATQLAECEMMRRPLRAAIAAWKPTDGVADVTKAIDSLIKVQEREASLLGLDKVAAPWDDIAGMTDAQLEAEIASWQLEMTT